MKHDKELLKTLGQLYETLTEKSAANPVILDMRNRSNEFDYTIITNSENAPHMTSLSKSVIEVMLKNGHRMRHTEGKAKNGEEWLLLDYGQIVVHIFSASGRDFYGLERIWADSKFLTPLELRIGSSLAPTAPHAGAAPITDGSCRPHLALGPHPSQGSHRMPRTFRLLGPHPTQKPYPSQGSHPGRRRKLYKTP